MKYILQFLFIFGLAIGFGFTTASAQPSAKINAAIPFNFTVGDKRIEAGEYNLALTKDPSGGAILVITDKEGKLVHTSLGRLVGERDRSGSDLVFARVGDDRYLSKVVIEDSSFSFGVRR
ncbi:MAG TPA: hypothetical protein PLP21_07140 [Pyrinomonadaceae bacterium]|nr:hypothetical protein [Pyrinomonadaceae bacterium]